MYEMYIIHLSLYIYIYIHIDTYIYIHTYMHVPVVHSVELALVLDGLTVKYVQVVLNQCSILCCAYLEY